jgi:hypothetical protein
VFSARTLTSTEARIVAEAYLRVGRNPNKVGDALGMADFDKEILAHPLVRREVIAIARVNSQNYSMVDHMEKLAEIRDAALAAEKFSAALGAEVSIGRAAGLNDKGRTDPDDVNDPAVEPKRLSSDQIRGLLAQRSTALPNPERDAEREARLEDEGDDKEDPDDFFRDADPPDDGLV